MTDITAKPFDWNDNLSEEAIEDFEGIQKDLPYCTCQNIGMALAKLELLEKQGCNVIEPKSEWQQDHEILKAYSDGANDVLDKIRAEIKQAADKQFQIAMGVADFNERYVHIQMENAYRHSLNIIDKYKAEGSDKE